MRASRFPCGPSKLFSERTNASQRAGFEPGQIAEHVVEGGDQVVFDCSGVFRTSGLLAERPEVFGFFELLLAFRVFAGSSTRKSQWLIPA